MIKQVLIHVLALAGGVAIIICLALTAKCNPNTMLLNDGVGYMFKGV